MATAIDQPEIDFLILADRAEAINGKIYMLGGGWDQLSVVDFKLPVELNLAVGILVPWTMANQNLTVSLHVEHEDGTVLQKIAQGNLTAGRPATSKPGQSFRIVLSFRGAMILPESGTYVAVGSVEGGNVKRVSFHAYQIQPIAQIG